MVSLGSCEGYGADRFCIEFRCRIPTLGGYVDLRVATMKLASNAYSRLPIALLYWELLSLFDYGLLQNP